MSGISTLTYTQAVFIALGIIAGLSLLGYRVLRLLDPRSGMLAILSAAYPLGAGIFTFLLFLTSWIGLPVTSISVASQYALSLLLLLLIKLLIGRKRARMGGIEPVQDSESERLAGMLAVIAIISVLTLAGAYLAVMRSYSTWDAIGIWGVKGYGIAREGTIFAARRWGSHGLSYPLNIPLQISLFHLFGGDPFFLSKLIFPAYYSSLLLAVWALLRDRSREGMSLIGLILIATIPMLFEHGTIGYANLAFSYYVVIGFLVLIKSRLSRPGVLIGAALLGIAVWTRPEGSYIVMIGMVALTLAALRLEIAISRRELALAVARVFIFLLPWQLFSALNSDQNVLGGSLAAMLESWAQGEFNLEAIYWTARFSMRQVIDSGVWGFILPVNALLMLVRWKAFSASQREGLYLCAAVFTSMLATIFAYFYLAAFTNDIQYLLGTSVNRIFMPAWTYLAATPWILSIE